MYKCINEYPFYACRFEGKISVKGCKKFEKRAESLCVFTVVGTRAKGLQNKLYLDSNGVVLYGNLYRIPFKEGNVELKITRFNVNEYFRWCRENQIDYSDIIDFNLVPFYYLEKGSERYQGACALNRERIENNREYTGRLGELTRNCISEELRQIKIRDKYYWKCDITGNKWSCECYTFEQAMVFRDNLEDCWNCVDCIECVNCNDCVNCTSCIDCSVCEDCIDCHTCDFCTGCKNRYNYLEKNEGI
jgi:hypothetical protein